MPLAMYESPCEMLSWFQWVCVQKMECTAFLTGLKHKAARHSVRRIRRKRWSSTSTSPTTRCRSPSFKTIIILHPASFAIHDLLSRSHHDIDDNSLQETPLALHNVNHLRLANIPYPQPRDSSSSRNLSSLCRNPQFKKSSLLLPHLRCIPKPARGE